MEIPEKWVQLLKEEHEGWDIEDLVCTLTKRRKEEKCIVKAENYKKGEKTLSMWLFGKEIYENMSLKCEETPTINRAIALHKMIKFITFSLGGDVYIFFFNVYTLSLFHQQGYLNFMGNEFGHPEQVDFENQ